MIKKLETSVFIFVLFFSWEGFTSSISSSSSPDELTESIRSLRLEKVTQRKKSPIHLSPFDQPLPTLEDRNAFKDTIESLFPFSPSTCPSVSDIAESCNLDQFIVATLGVSAEVYYHEKCIRCLVSNNIITLIELDHGKGKSRFDTFYKVIRLVSENNLFKDNEEEQKIDSYRLFGNECKHAFDNNRLWPSSKNLPEIWKDSKPDLIPSTVPSDDENSSSDSESSSSSDNDSSDYDIFRSDLLSIKEGRYDGIKKTQSWIADYLGVSESTVSLFLRGQTTSSPKMLYKWNEQGGLKPFLKKKK